MRCLLVLPLMLAGCPDTLSQFEMPTLRDIRGTSVSDAEYIAAVLAEVQNGIETKRVYRVLAHVSRSYNDQEGRDYDALQEYLARLFRDYRDIRITRTRPRVAVSGNTAIAQEAFGTQARPVNPGGRPINIQGQMTVRLVKENNTWRILEWGPLQ